MNDEASTLQDILRQLENPISDAQHLSALLCAPLAALSLLPSSYKSQSIRPLPSPAVVLRAIPRIQYLLLSKIIPVWESSATVLDETLFQTYFCPSVAESKFSFEIVLMGVSSLLSTTPIQLFAARMLVQLSQEYPMGALFMALFTSERWTAVEKDKAASLWEDYIQSISAVPAKVANALGASRLIPAKLENLHFFNNLISQFESLVFEISSTKLMKNENVTRSLTYALLKFVNIGLFPVSQSPTQPSFFSVTLQIIRRRDYPGYWDLWVGLFSEMPSLSFRSILLSLLSCLSSSSGTTLDPSVSERQKIKLEALLLLRLIGQPNANDEKRSSIWQVSTSVIIDKTWPDHIGRMLICWIALACPAFEDDSMQQLLEIFVDQWTSPDHIKHSLLSRHRYLTLTLLVVLSYFEDSSSPIMALAVSPPFIKSIGDYISHLDPPIRLCGMLAAEVVAQKSGRKLDFGGWEGENEDKTWCRGVRQLLSRTDASTEMDSVESTVEVFIEPGVTQNSRSRIRMRSPSMGADSDDSLTGYDSPSTSSRTPSPTPSELSELEKDPTLRNPGKKIVRRPLYLYDLAQLLKPSGSGLDKETGQGEAERMAMALQVANDLIRRKKHFGLELEENAVNLAHAFLGLHNNYDLDDFDQQRQLALTALVTCCPKKSAPAIIEQFFSTQYSTEQKFAILNALAIGARELAGLPVPKAPAVNNSFPSRMLPPALHKKYITDSDSGQVQNMFQGITQLAIDKGRETAANKAPELVRERQLRVRTPAKAITEVKPSHSFAQVPTAPETSFKDIAAEYFLGPFINQFWIYVNDENMRESRSSLSKNAAYRGAGTGMVLNPMVLSHFLETLGVLVHAARNSPAFLAVLGPEALELAVILGTRPIATGRLISTESQAKDAAVLRACLEIALVVTDACLELDGGRALGLEHTALAMGAHEWAGKVFSAVEKGIRTEGGGGAEVARMNKVAAALLIRMEELISRWGRSMITT